MPDVFDGVSAEDVVGETLVAYLTSADKLGWDKNKGPLEPYLWIVCKHKLFDHFRRSKHEQPQPHEYLDQRAGEGPTSEEEAIYRDLLENIKKRMKGDQEAIDYIDSVDKVSIHGNGKFNQHMAIILQTSTQDIVNRKKRVGRKVADLF